MGLEGILNMKVSKTTPSLLTLKEGSTALPKPLSPHGRGDVNRSSRRSDIKVDVGIRAPVLVFDG